MLTLLGVRASALPRLSAESVRAYLVDPASSHMLVSKVKPCMPKFPLDLQVKPRTAH